MAAPTATFTSTVPTRCIERHPTRRTITFAGVPVSVTQVAESYTPALDIGYLSKILRKQRMPSIDVGQLIAQALGMQFQAFITELQKGER